jgi:methanesulfonate monooxygenase large subunit
MTKNAQQWAQTPPFPSSHFVDTRIYTDEVLFQEEQQKIFNTSWIIACHESELVDVFDYRTFTHPGGASVFVVKTQQGSFQAFYNVCQLQGQTLLWHPAGTAKHVMQGSYQLREVQCAVGYGGFVWINVNDSAGTLAEYIGDAMSMLDEQLDMPLEVFHYHKAIVDTNYKLWHDTNSEFYHDYMHYFNRATGMIQPGYFDRRYTGYENGHASVGSMEIKYDAYAGSKARSVGWPGLAPGGWVLIDLFPGMTFNLRTSVLRMDTAIPLGPNKLIVEFRGLGLRSDTPEQRAERIRDHNFIWGPFGRNLHEDLLGVHGQGRAMRKGTDSQWVIHGREENSTIHDEVGMRHFYAEWGRKMGRPASNPMGDRLT